MTRPLRLQFAGAHYHVMNRGNARQTVFHDDNDYAAFLDLLGQTCVERDWHCLAHCLMPNHFHLLIRTAQPNLARGMRQLTGVFTQRYNKRRARVGHLFQGRYKSPLIERGRYLHEVARYIVLNPVRAGLVSAPGMWRWSAWKWLAGERAAPAWASPQPIWSQLADDPQAAARVFREQASEGVARTNAGAAVSAGVVGSERFRTAQRPRLVPHRATCDYSTRERHADRPALAQIFATPDSRKVGAARDAALREALKRWDYTQAEVAAFLGLHPGTVARLMWQQRILERRT